MEYILAFGSAHKALKAESILKKASVEFRLLPAPKVLVPYCDLVISVSELNYNKAREALDASGQRLKAVYRKEGEEYAQV
jgi:hypothetical protein